MTGKVALSSLIVVSNFSIFTFTFFFASINSSECDKSLKKVVLVFPMKQKLVCIVK